MVTEVGLAPIISLRITGREGGWSTQDAPDGLGRWSEVRPSERLASGLTTRTPAVAGCRGGSQDLGIRSTVWRFRAAGACSRLSRGGWALGPGFLAVAGRRFGLAWGLAAGGVPVVRLGRRCC